MLNWAGLGSGWTGLNWAGLDWTGLRLGCVGLEWAQAGLCWAVFVDSFLLFSGCSGGVGSEGVSI